MEHKLVRLPSNFEFYTTRLTGLTYLTNWRSFLKSGLAYGGMPAEANQCRWPTENRPLYCDFFLVYRNFFKTSVSTFTNNWLTFYRLLAAVQGRGT